MDYLDEVLSRYNDNVVEIKILKDLLRKSLFKKLDVNAQTKESIKILGVSFPFGPGVSALHIASAGGCLDIVDILVKYSANVNIKDTSEFTPLFYALLFGQYKIADYLLANGAIIDSYVMLTGLAFRGCFGQNVEYLINHGADPNATSKFDVSILTFAAKIFNYRFIESLLKYNINVNYKDGDGKTALDYAIMGLKSVTGKKDMEGIKAKYEEVIKLLYPLTNK
jgi:hypothetical protein